MKRITTLIAIGMSYSMLISMSSVDRQSCPMFCPILCAGQCCLLLTPVDRLPEVIEKQPAPRDKASRDKTSRNQDRGDSPIRRLTEDQRNGRGQFFDQRQLPPNFVEHVMAVAKEVDPALAIQLSSMCETDPEGFEKVIRRQGRRLGSLIRLRDSDPELFEIKVNELKADAEIVRITQEIRETGIKDQLFLARLEQLRAQIRVKIALSIRAKTFYIERMEQHLKRMKSDLETTTTHFDEIVDERVEQLIQNVEDGDSKKPTKEE